MAQISLWSVRQEISRGHLRASRIGRVVRVTPRDYKAWVDSKGGESDGGQ